MKKIKILVSSLLILSIFAGVGCSSKTDKVNNKPKEKTNLVWAGWSGEEEANKETIKEIIDIYNNSTDMSEISWVGWPWANTLQQLIIRTQSNQDLDVAQVDMAWLATLAKMDVLVDLNEILGEDWMKQNLSDASLNSGNIDGKQLAVPWTQASIGMVYNPTILKNAGVDKVPQTVEEFEAALKKIKEYDKDIIPYAAATKEAGSIAKDVNAWFWTFGGQYIDDDGKVVINSEANEKALTWYKGLKDKGYIAMDLTRFDARQLFAQNKVAFYDDAILARGIAKSNGVSEDKLDETIKPMERPVLKAGDKPQSTLWGHQLVIFKSAKDKEKAGDFIKYLISEETSLKYFEASGSVPVMKSAINSEKVKNDNWSSEWLKITETGKKAETQKFENDSQLATIITEEIQNTLLGAKTPKKALEDAQMRLEQNIN
ncbi:sugar ABC transporter periplasmic protein [Clostridium sartagoforme AAU1]|uniref:Sugar ABC transporter periplasmic protein n=1 Tax=Clostridium sartagoforme AAU1 TaxID=1202534 RepID=R9C7R2_9CLOT|nr:sugar ABC transporter substrate-binding protein [Clostridium sartagoforme]EOR25045.1 sugar ABC transporter periplasmic protein [Clostridium sartagoforme AAU1]